MVLAAPPLAGLTAKFPENRDFFRLASAKPALGFDFAPNRAGQGVAGQGICCAGAGNFSRAAGKILGRAGNLPNASGILLKQLLLP